MKIYKEAMMILPSKIMGTFIRWRIKKMRNSEKKYLGYISNQQRIYEKIKSDRKELENLLKKE